MTGQMQTGHTGAGLDPTLAVIRQIEATASGEDILLDDASGEYDDGGTPPVSPDGDPFLEACAGEPETDIGNGRRFLLRWRGDVLHLANIGWHVYDGTRWAEDEGGRLIRPRAHKTVERIAAESWMIRPSATEEALIEQGRAAADQLKAMGPLKRGADASDVSVRRELEEIVAAGAEAEKAVTARRASRRRYGKTSGSSGKLDNMLREAAPYVTRMLNDMDLDPLAINLGSGTLRLIGEDDPDNPDPDEPRMVWHARHDAHQREDMITKLMPVEYDPKARCPQFLAFLERVQPLPQMRAFLKRYFGYCCTALTSEQCFVFFYGEGRNGKSTLVDLIARIMADYSTTVPFETLAGDDRRKGGEATPDLARLPGARMVRAAEPEQGMKFRESMIKSLTSGEPILIRRLHAEFNEVYPKFKLVISGNHKPDVRGADDGIWRRVLLVPWEVQIPKNEVDRALPDKLWAERSGILNWLVEGAIEYLTYGLDVPEEVRSATDTYREESDPIGAFLESECEVTGDPDHTADPGALYAAYKLFCEQQAFNVWTAATFQKQLPMKAKKLGFLKAKTQGRSLYRGIRLNPAGASAQQGWTS